MHRRRIVPQIREHFPQRIGRWRLHLPKSPHKENSDRLRFYFLDCSFHPVAARTSLWWQSRTQTFQVRKELSELLIARRDKSRRNHSEIIGFEDGPNHRNEPRIISLQ